MFVFLKKQYPENFAFLILRIFELLAREVYKYLKKQANFQHIPLFRNACKQTFHIYHIYYFAHISKSKRCFNVKSPTYYFHIKANTMADFQICISVTLKMVTNMELALTNMSFIHNSACVIPKWLKLKRSSQSDQHISHTYFLMTLK